MVNSQLVKVASAIIVADKKILLLQRDNTPGIRDPNCWQLPGGGVEEGESSDEAIKRELQEEISVIPESLRFLTSPSPDVSVHYACLTDEEVRAVKKGNEGRDLRFFSFDELSAIPLTQKLQKVVETKGEFLKSLLDHQVE